jgi:putative nucleotidyltransferase with HDIG domain
MISSARHRVEQFWRHSAGRVPVAEEGRAAEVLGPILAPLFQALPRNERRHGLDVLATVDRLEGRPDRLLRQAALLHDMGKTQAHLSVLDRSQAVFLRAVSPGLFRAYLRLRPGFARRYRLYRDHGAIGAQRLRDLGAGELAQIVAEHHERAPSHPLTSRLKLADERN